MKTLVLFADQQRSIPATTSWYLDALGEFRGKQELYTRQSPQRLKVLREHALIESAVSSNRIEGVSVEPSRIQSVLIATKPLLRDRDEEEIRGYRDALSWIHEHAAEIPLDEACPGVGREWIRSVLADMRKEGELKCSGRGIGARWSLSSKQG